MKNYILYALIFFLSSCAGAYKKTSTGLADIGFISIVGDGKKYNNGVLVYVDELKPVITEVLPAGKIVKRQTQVTVPAGKHLVKVTYEGRVIYQQSMIFFAQETKEIVLP
ncbi:MAG: hypothetical protein O9340_10535 [Cyclobacteriaceae bacterium]|jgi:hypothetical protein|nr:hypothetical protein [Cyclobacteriaceae bacterium]